MPRYRLSDEGRRRLRDCRDKTSLTTQQIADKLNLSSGSINHVLYATQAYPIERITEVCLAVGFNEYGYYLEPEPSTHCHCQPVFSDSPSQPNRTLMGFQPEPSENQMIQDCKKRRGKNPITRKWEDVTEGSICNLNQDYEYRLIVKDISHASDLPSNECVFDVDLTKVLRRKVFILKVNDYYHVRIFDRVGELVVDKGKDEFSPDENLIQQFDEALNQTLDRQDERNLIQDITSSISYSLYPELDLEFALEICFDNQEGSSNFTIRPSNEESRLRKDENIYLVFDVKLSKKSKDLCLGFRCIDEFTTQYCYSINQGREHISLPIIRYRARWQKDETYKWHSFALRLDNPDHWHPFPKDGFQHPPEVNYKVKYQEILGIVFELGTSTNENDCSQPKGGSGLFWLRNIQLKSKDNLENIQVIETE